MDLTRKILMSIGITLLFSLISVIINGALQGYTDLSTMFFYIEEVIKTISIIYLTDDYKTALLLCLVTSLTFSVTEVIYHKVMINCYYLLGIPIHVILTNLLGGNIAVLIALNVRRNAFGEFQNKIMPLIPYLLILIIPSIAHFALNNIGFTHGVMCSIDQSVINNITAMFS
jgi:hypothetical protein